ncbi:MAG TPA: F0F1 ATP synthase subunit delta [Geobacteraceae bacterium]|nr:F0F1 ATP synthase subunit delta [Geobacteraceae bacterium]
MKFNVWTFLFQIINFIVLLFILKRLLYRPVRQILEKRRALIQESIENAEKVGKEAQELKERHEAKLRELDAERERMLDGMRAEALEEKRRLLAEAAKETDARLAQGLALLEMENRTFAHGLKERAVETVTLFSTKILQGIADEDLHRALWRRLLAGLGAIAQEMAGKGLREEALEIELCSAYPLGEEDIDVLRKSLESLLSRKVQVRLTVDGALIAGVTVRSRDMVYDSSLAGQVNAFGARLKAE